MIVKKIVFIFLVMGRYSIPAGFGFDTDTLYKR